MLRVNPKKFEYSHRWELIDPPSNRDWTVYVGTSTRTAPSGKFSYEDITAYNASFMLFRTDSDYKLNAASSTCPTPSALPSAYTPITIAGNGSELGYKVREDERDE